jgi:hypothetical protein
MSGETVVAALLGTLIGAAVGVIAAALTLLGVYVKARTDLKLKEVERDNQIAMARWNLEAEYEKDLRKTRIEVYKELFVILKLIIGSERITNNLTESSIQNIVDKLRDWYYEKGGVFLSTPSYHHFMMLQVYLYRDFLIPLKDNEAIEDDDLFKTGEKIARASLDLSESLIDDINTRKAISFPDRLQPLPEIKPANKPTK